MPKSLYEVAAGIEFVNGTPVPKSREVRLTETEARFDLQMGRIALKPVPPKQAQRTTAKKTISAQGDADKVADEVRG